MYLKNLLPKAMVQTTVLRLTQYIQFQIILLSSNGYYEQKIIQVQYERNYSMT